MATRYFATDDVPDGYELDRSHEVDGAVRGTYRKPGEKISGQANFIELDGPPDSNSSGFGTGVVAGLALVGLGALAIKAVSSKFSSLREDQHEPEEPAPALGRPNHSDRESAPPPADWYDDGSGVMRWWDGNQWTQFRQNVRTPMTTQPGWYNDGSGVLRWWDGTQWTSYYQNRAPVAVASPGWYDDGSGYLRWWDGQQWGQYYQAPQSSSTVSSSPASDSLSSTPVISMTKDEWAEHMRTLLLAERISALEWKILCHARISNADTDLLNWQQDLKRLTPQEFLELVRQSVAVDPAPQRQAIEPARAPQNDVVQNSSRWGLQLPSQPYQTAQVGLPDTPTQQLAPGYYRCGGNTVRYWNGRQWH